MNPAIEYFIRRGLAQDALQMPCSLFLYNSANHHKRMIVTLRWHSFSKKCLVSQWNVSAKCSDDIMPPFTEYAMDRSEIFTSDKVIVPNYNLLSFKPQPYKAGITQRSDGPTGNEQEAEYRSTIDRFFSPARHERHRLTWLWNTFLLYLELHYLAINSSQYIEEQMYMTQKHYKEVWQRWTKWSQHFLIHSPVASELVFYSSYMAKARRENRSPSQNWFAEWKQREPLLTEDVAAKKQKYFSWVSGQRMSTENMRDDASTCYTYTFTSDDNGYYIVSAANEVPAESPAPKVWFID